MKYLIVYLIRGEAGEYHRKLVSRFSKFFEVNNLNDHIPPHLTLKAPFHTDKIKDVEVMLEEFVEGIKRTDIKLNGISHFNKRVLFMGADFSKDAKLIYQKFVKLLKKISWMSWDIYDGKGAFHATLGYSKSDSQFKMMWDYLVNEKFDFNLKWDNITIFEMKKGDRWRIHRVFEIK